MAGGTPATPGSNPAPIPGSAQAKVVMVVEENAAYEDVIGGASMPYLNSLAAQGALATEYYANVHPSIGNYLMLTSGKIETVLNTSTDVFSDDNIARELNTAGKTWKVYAEDLPQPGYLGGDTAEYLRHHNPFVYYSDVANDPAQAAKVVPFPQFSTDLNAGTLPNFSFVIPNAIHDGHDCAVPGCSESDLLSAADQWLQANVSPLLANSQFGTDGLLIVLFDESQTLDVRHVGGHVALVAVGPKAKTGARSSTFYQHENTLKTVCVVMGLTTCPGAAASAAAQTDLLK
ncbi:MAG TPA: alkaline phosphatase family protein [Terriglobales bacterium]|nr:alkaline phosphatase family protein [Terriglobales bacterium]